MPKPMPRLVVFDLAGTTMQDDGTVGEAFRMALRTEGLACTPDQILAVRGASKREAFRQLTEDSAQAERALRSFLTILAQRYRERPAQEVLGASAVFSWLRDLDVKLALNTGFDRTTLETLLASLGWNPAWFSGVVCGDDVSAGRPDPAMILEAMRRAGVAEAARVMVVGDTVLDLQAGAAAQAGWIVGVTSGAHGHDRLLEAPHTHLAASIAGLREVLR